MIHRTPGSQFGKRLSKKANRGLAQTVETKSQLKCLVEYIAKYGGAYREIKT